MWFNLQPEEEIFFDINKQTHTYFYEINRLQGLSRGEPNGLEEED